jgi:ribonuclease BN (tRNA processing enzyme)
MKLTILGSGTSVPHRERSSSAYWLAAGGTKLLLDCSASAVHRMAQEGLPWAELDAVWISHFHLDHCGGLASYLFGTKHAPDTQKREKPLTIYGPEGLRGLIERFDAVNDYGLFEQPFPLEVKEVRHLEQFDIGGLEAAAIKTPHTGESLALHLRDENGRTLMYTADTGPSDALASFGRHTELILIECSFIRDKPVEKHLELAEAIYLIRKAQPKHAVLTHLYPEWDAASFEREVAEFSPGVRISEAKDGLVIEVGK